MIGDLMLQLIGLLAGCTVCLAAVPRAVQVLRSPDLGRTESVSRNSFLVAGNMLWVAYGVGSHALALVTMCGLNVLLNGVILYSRLRGARPRDGA